MSEFREAFLRARRRLAAAFQAALDVELAEALWDESDEDDEDAAD